MNIDFKSLKERVGVEAVIPLIPSGMTKRGDQWRGICPACPPQDRSLVLTPGKGFYCWSAKKGGSVIDLIAHVRGIDIKEAARLIAEHTGTGSQERSSETGSRTVPPVPTGKEAERSLQPLGYLEASSEAVQKLGVSAETAKLFESGYAPKGVLRGRYAVPVRDRNGSLVAYVGIAVTPEQSPHLLFHNFNPASVIWNIERVSEGGDLYVCRDPLQAILAVENGIQADQVVSFLAPITAQALEVLAALMDTKRVENIEFH